MHRLQGLRLSDTDGECERDAHLECVRVCVLFSIIVLKSDSGGLCCLGPPRKGWRQKALL